MLSKNSRFGCIAFLSTSWDCIPLRMLGVPQLFSDKFYDASIWLLLHSLMNRTHSMYVLRWGHFISQIPGVSSCNPLKRGPKFLHPLSSTHTHTLSSLVTPNFLFLFCWLSRLLGCEPPKPALATHSRERIYWEYTQYLTAPKTKQKSQVSERTETRARLRSLMAGTAGYLFRKTAWMKQLLQFSVLLKFQTTFLTLA